MKTIVNSQGINTQNGPVGLAVEGGSLTVNGVNVQESLKEMAKSLAELSKEVKMIDSLADSLKQLKSCVEDMQQVNSSTSKKVSALETTVESLAALKESTAKTTTPVATSGKKTPKKDDAE